MCKFVALILLTLSSSVWANTYTVCGSGHYEEDGMEFEKLELSLSTEFNDFEGPVGERWNFRIGEQDWLERNVTARSFEKNSVTNVEFKFIMGRTPSGPVGIRYVLLDMNSDQPRLEKYTMGGFAGSVLVGTYSCNTAFD